MSQQEGDHSELVVLVRVEHELYGLPVRAVREVLPLCEPAPMPGWPAHALGLLNVRGTMIPLVDPAPILGSAPRRLSSSQQILILSEGQQLWGLVVDAVEGVIPPGPLTQGGPASFQTAAIARLCHGMFLAEAGPVLLLDPLKLADALRASDVPLPTGRSAAEAPT